jgi:hypothetical protein
MLHTILGIEPDPTQPGFTRAHLRPTLGPLREARGTVPTPHGNIAVALQREGEAIATQVESPIPLIIESSDLPLPPGSHRLTL